MTKPVLLISILSMLMGCDKHVTGFVYDCKTNAAIDNAQVSSNQTGWGMLDGTIVWDKAYQTLGRTGSNGAFELSYKLNKSAKIRVDVDGYHPAEQYAYPGNNIKIGLLLNDGKTAPEITYNCTPSSKCLKCTKINGVTECRNDCLK